MSKQRPLREQLKQHMQQEQLSAQELATLQQKLNRRPRRLKPWQPALAAAAAVLLMLGIWLGQPGHAPQGSDTVTLRIAEEVLTNHLHLRSMDIHTDDFETLRQGMEKLNFVPVNTAHNQPALRLQGGRYCTLQGALATQLVFISEQGETVTYYQAAYDPKRFGALPDRSRQQQPLVLIHNGVQIRIWVEQGVLVAQASSGNPAARPGLS